MFWGLLNMNLPDVRSIKSVHIYFIKPRKNYKYRDTQVNKKRYQTVAQKANFWFI